jgi:hypothetical protein
VYLVVARVSGLVTGQPEAGIAERSSFTVRTECLGVEA